MEDERARHAACLGDAVRNTSQTVIGKSEGKGIQIRPKRRWNEY
jgi:hypothetical protein